MKPNQTFKLLIKHKYLTILAAAVDMLFLIALGFYTMPILQQLIVQGRFAGAQLSKALAKQPTKSYAQLLFTDTIKPYSTAVLALMLLLFLTIFVLYVVFQGTTWWMSNKIAGKKTSYLKYIKKFCKVSIPLVIIAFAIHLLDQYLSLKYTISKYYGNATSPDALITILFSALAVMAFYAAVKPETLALFKTPPTKSIKIIGLLGFLALAWYMIMLIGGTSRYIALALGILLFPAYTLIRVTAIKVMQ